MGTRRFVVCHQDSAFNIDYDTEHGLEGFKSLLYTRFSIPPDEQIIIGEDDDREVTEDADLMEVSEMLRVLWMDEQGSEEGDDSLLCSCEISSCAEVLEELMFEQDIMSHIDTVLMYEDPVRQDAARRTVPIEELKENALVALAEDGISEPTEIEKDHAFMLQLLSWFKNSFSWVDQPTCDNCRGTTISHGRENALPSENQFAADVVELYRCLNCSEITRFPRYNDPLQLIETRRGRCGEWANCFTFYCRSFGYETRLILDFTDHLWTECFSLRFRRWVHLDPCEGACDDPLLYENKWGKELNYVVAIAQDGVYDVSKRYTRKWDEVLGRRNLIEEEDLKALLHTITEERRSTFSAEIVSRLEDRDDNEQEELESNLHSSDHHHVV